MAFPATLSALLAAGYDNPRWGICPVCGLGVEIWTTPGKRTIAMEPTHSDSPVVRHYEVCAPKQEEQSGIESSADLLTESSSGSLFENVQGRTRASESENRAGSHSGMGRQASSEAQRGREEMERPHDGSPRSDLLQTGRGRIESGQGTGSAVGSGIKLCQCWRIVGEFFRCRMHGGGTWTKEALAWQKKHPPKPIEIPPADFMDPFWSWLDDAPKNPKFIKMRVAQQEVMELIP